jgi:hypothetical protein
VWLPGRYLNDTTPKPLIRLCPHEAEVSCLRLIGPLWGHKADLRERRTNVGNEKLSDEQRAGNNRIQASRSLNQCCAPNFYLESMLLTRTSKNVFRQHRPKADSKTDD